MCIHIYATSIYLSIYIFIDLYICMDVNIIIHIDSITMFRLEWQNTA